MHDLRKWTGLLEEAIGPALATGKDEATHLAAKLAGKVSVNAITRPPSLNRHRPEQRAYLSYIDALTRTAMCPAPIRLDEKGPAVRIFAHLSTVAVDGRPSDGMRQELGRHNGQSFSMPGSDDQLDSWWFSELTALHGTASYAVLTADPRAWAVVRRGCDFHHAEIQPDHATSDPWAIHAFVLHPTTHNLAETLLNATMIHHAGEPRGLALVLLAEALYCLRHVAKHGQPEPV